MTKELLQQADELSERLNCFHKDCCEHCTDNFKNSMSDAKLIQALADEVRGKWQDISTAPKDGEVFCYSFDWSESGVALAEDFGEYWQVSDRDDDTKHFKPTHWMPLPNKPQEDK